MKKIVRFVIPGEQRETRNPACCSWIPACAGMTEADLLVHGAHHIAYNAATRGSA
jgi:hypothetical protein